MSPEEIRIQALAFAQDFADDMHDLITAATVIEKWILGETVSLNPETHSQSEIDAHEKSY